MARWQPGSRQRIQDAALELFARDGYAQVTAADVAEHAGVNVRTFYRHFPDKKEVLFGDGERLQQLILDAVDLDPSAPPHAAIRTAFDAVARDLQPRYERLARRAAIIAVTPELQERELRKGTSWASALAERLTARGTVDAATAAACSHAAAAVFHVAFRRWLESGGTTELGETLEAGLASLSALQPPH
jgi:AcrR family transcriptional regulator